MFVDSHEQPDIMKDWYHSLTKIEELKPYIIEFNEDGEMKAKNYPVDYVVRGEKFHSIIVIIYNECTFFPNDRVWKV